MAQPTPYDRQFSFQDFQAQEPTTPLPGDEVDGELNAVKVTLDQTLVNLAKIQRDDGALKNGIVTQDSLSDSLSIGFTLRGEWQEGVNYYLSDGVTVGSKFYRATASALSTAGNAPGQPDAPWLQVADFTEATSEAAASAAAALASENAAAGSASAAASSASAAASSAGAASGSASGAAASASDASDSADAAAASAAEAANLIGGTVTQAVRWDTPQSLTSPQKTQARDNIGVEQSIVANAKDGEWAQPYDGAVVRTLSGKFKEFISVADFGAQGGTDSTTAFKNWAAALGEFGGLGYIPPAADPYQISEKIELKTTRTLDPYLPGDGIHFSDMTPMHIIGTGARIQATAAMTAMFELVFDVSDADIAPFRSHIEGIAFDGANLATVGVKSNYCMHNSFVNNSFDNISIGIDYIGYGVAVIKKNIFRCRTGIHYFSGGGDSTIEANDFYYSANFSQGIKLEYYGGNTRIRDNIFSHAQSYTNIYGVQIYGFSAPASQEIRHVDILNNEFCGLAAGVRVDGKASGNKNAWLISLTGNHTNPFATNNPGVLLEAVDATDLRIENNFCNGVRLPDATGQAIALIRCERATIKGNKIGNYASAAVFLTDCNDTVVESNEADDCGKLGTGYTIFQVFGTGSRNLFILNKLRQTSASYAQNGVFSSAGGGAQQATNFMRNIGTAYTNVSAITFA